jgi:phospholipid/cholesterol/gamma-HCH transport system substrate-binding protein
VSRRRGHEPRNPFTIGLIALVVLLPLLYLGFRKDLPFRRGFEISAVFESANGLRETSPVRIAGVNVGKVVRVEPVDGAAASRVVMEIDDAGQPVHADATAKIRPRIFLEGNFFVDLRPGTPGAPALDDGDAIPIAQTATPVQLDEVLTSLQSDTRQDLVDVLDSLAAAWNRRPSAADDRAADRSARGQTAAGSLNDAYDDLGPAERSTAVVNQALLGTRPRRDLARLLRGGSRAAAGLARSEIALRALVGNFNTTAGALAQEQGALGASVRELAPTLAVANRALRTLDAALPPTRAWAREILPGVRQTAATIDAARPWIRQAHALLAESELQGLAARLAPVSRDLAQLSDEALALLPQTDAAARCARDVVLPTGDVPIRDEFATGAENYKEFFYSLVGLAGEGQGFDGNGQYVRFQTGGGDNVIRLGRSNLGGPPQFGALPVPTIGTRPRYPGRRPPYRPAAPCADQPLPDLDGPASARGPGSVPPTR